MAGNFLGPALGFLGGLFGGGGGGGSSPQQDALYAYIQSLLQQYANPALGGLYAMSGLGGGAGQPLPNILDFGGFGGTPMGGGAPGGTQQPGTGLGGKPLAPGMGGGGLPGFTGGAPGFNFLNPWQQSRLETGSALDQFGRSIQGARGDALAGLSGLGQSSAASGADIALRDQEARGRSDIIRGGIQRQRDLTMQGILSLLGAIPGVSGQAGNLAGLMAQSNQFNALQGQNNMNNWFGGLGAAWPWLFPQGGSTGTQWAGFNQPLGWQGL